MSDPTAENFVTIVVDGKTYAAFWDVSSDGLVNVHLDGKTYSTQTGPAPQSIARMILRERLQGRGIARGLPCDDLGRSTSK
jgi:hypothetical protein